MTAVAGSVPPEPSLDASGVPQEHGAGAAEDAAQAAVLRFDAVSRWYGQVIAVNDVNVAVAPGITALLGPNGAGKSTLMRMALGLIQPSQGQVRVLGEDPWNNAPLMRRVGYVAAGPPAWGHLSALQAVLRGARLAGVSDEIVQGASRQALLDVGLDPDDDRPVAAYSHGMQQRVKFALATVHAPQLLILDEPLLGTDPIVRQLLLEAMRQRAARGTAILVSTHVLADVEALTERILLLHHGRVLGHGTVGAIRDLLDRHPRTVRITGPRPELLARELLAWDSVQSVHKDPGAVVVRTHAAADFFPRLQDAMADGQLHVDSVATLDDNVEAVVRYLGEASA